MAAPVPSVVHAFAIIRTLAEGRAMTLSEVAARCEISPSSCLGLLRTLVGEGVLQPADGKRYALNAPWSAIAAGGTGEMDRLLARARAPLDRAARAWSAPVGLWRVVGRDRLQLAVLGQSAAATRIHMEEGQRQPIGGGCVGRALAAAEDLSADERARRFAGVRWQAPMTEQDYAVQVAEARARGYAVDDGLTHAGITSVGVCVAGGPPIFCLSASVFAGSRTPDELDALARMLGDLGAEIVAASGTSLPPPAGAPS